MIRPTVKIVRSCDGAQLPSYAHSTDSGADLIATHDVCLSPGETSLIHTGISIALPEGYEAQVRSKSGRALKESLFVLNSPGTVDNGYRGEVCVILHNGSHERRYVNQGEKVAQLVVTPYVQATFAEVGQDEFDQLATARGGGGFGSTGLGHCPRPGEPGSIFTLIDPEEPGNTLKLCGTETGRIPCGGGIPAQEDKKAWPFETAGHDNTDGRQIERRPDF